MKRIVLAAMLVVPLLCASADLAIHPDITAVIEVPGDKPDPKSWGDSYSVGNSCYCYNSNLDHGIADFMVRTPLGWMKVQEVCEELGPGPGMNETTPVYNDVQCGNGPPNDYGDEHRCPGRIDIGPEGCGHIGPLWNWLPLLPPSVTQEMLDEAEMSGGFVEQKEDFPKNALYKISFGAVKLSEGYDPPDKSKILKSGLIESFGGLGVPIKDSDGKNVAYGSHIWATGMVGYRFEVNPNKKYVVKVGVAEAWAPYCVPGGRRYNLFIGTNQILPDVDPYMMAGNRCQTAYDIIVSDVRPDILGSLVVKAQVGSSNSPFLSMVEVAEQPDDWNL